MKKIYFAGSIRGGRDFVDTYHEMINRLQDKYIVLTEHLGDKNLGHDGEKEKTDEHIYERDCSWIREADFIVAEVTNPSLGVGYEIGYAESLEKPIVCLYRKSEKRISAMVNGNKSLCVYAYDNIEEANKLVKEFVSKNIN